MDQTKIVITPTRQAAVSGLAVVGFIALIVLGVALGVYSARFVPGVVNRIGSAAVYLGSVFTPASNPGLSVVTASTTPTASTTISFGTASSTTATTTTTTQTATTRTPPAHTTTTHPVTVTTIPTTVAPHGLPDLALNISAIGYLDNSSPDSFTGSGSVPAGKIPAVKFTIRNIGTNWSGTWRFSASIPTRRAFVYQSDPQQSLAPGDSIDYTLGFDQALTGSNQMVTITVNFDNSAQDSNANNNVASAPLTIN